MEADWEDAVQVDLVSTGTEGERQPLRESVGLLCRMLTTQAADAERSLRSAKAECLAVEAVAKGLWERLQSGV